MEPGSNPDRRGEKQVLYRWVINSHLNFEDKANNKILESSFAAKRQRQFLRNFLSVEKEQKNKNGTHQRLLRE
jgi:adenine C2-methylase RlmN of 23S rRNA A2503 and tRNA A37